MRAKVTPEKSREYNARYAANHPEKVRESKRASAAKRRAERREELRAADRRRYAANLEKSREAARLNYARNREKIMERAREYREKHPVEVRALNLKWKAENRERKAKISALWGARNKQRVRENNARWHTANPDKCAALQRNRVARQYNAPGRYTTADVANLFDAQHGQCAGCAVVLAKSGKGKKYHVDHIVPLVRGGSNGPENLQLLCPFCNLSKHDKTPEEWAKARGLLLS